MSIVSQVTDASTREHGSVNMYSNLGCRCEACKTVWARYTKERRHNYGKRNPCSCGKPKERYAKVCSTCARANPPSPSNKMTYSPMERYWHLTVMYEEGRSKGGEVMVHVLCDCGRTKIVTGRNMRRGYTRSCGCGLGTQSGTSVAPETKGPKNTGSKPEVDQ